MKKNFQVAIIFTSLLLSGCNEKKPEPEEIKITSNWRMISQPAEVDPFTKKRKPSFCYITDQAEQYYILKNKYYDKEMLVFNFDKSVAKTIAEEHLDELIKIKIYLSSLSDAAYANGNISTHTKITNSSGKGKVISEVINGYPTSTDYPNEFEYEYMKAVKDKKFNLNTFCGYIMSDSSGSPIKSGIPSLVGCDHLSFTIEMEDIKYLIEESKSLNNSDYVIRVETFHPTFRERFYKINSYVKNKTYNYKINLTGLEDEINKISSCEDQ